MFILDFFYYVPNAKKSREYIESQNSVDFGINKNLVVFSVKVSFSMKNKLTLEKISDSMKLQCSVPV